ncbi:MAG: thioredoxin domain-containing protein, partial [Bdellovibrionales bacterium]|nr:thioredoxin domain-containing protein [Bdellovibrionales bacterium]
KLKPVLLTTVLLVAVFAGGSLWYKASQQAKREKAIAETKDLLERPESPFMGPSDAPVRVVEFLDPECEACAAFYPVVKMVLKDYPNQIKLIVRYLPLHGNSAYAASILEVLRARGKFWEGLEMFFAKQPEWGDHQTPKPELLKTYAAALGVSNEELEAALKDSMYMNHVKQDHSDARALGVRRTPTFFVNGKPLEDLSYKALKEMIGRELAE